MSSLNKREGHFTFGVLFNVATSYVAAVCVEAGARA